ncbi:hypothetical protein PRABACTJOHN_02580 [Parabacteroides johnsonii DSM 18315]|uniref:Uncharacterized protein n=1 Tax=Parabacteroides johnsonii DSM 18315 TaxID=537006 RepID=B7BC13_9BACT|nr:hypothetical protein PRABACTJOHN_02580 [Parabacteroides johnsonii DSM 18315]
MFKDECTLAVCLHLLPFAFTVSSPYIYVDKKARRKQNSG